MTETTETNVTVHGYMRRGRASSGVLADMVERLIEESPDAVVSADEVIRRIRDLVSRADAAKLLGCSQNTILYHGRSGRFREFSDGCRLWFDRRQLESVGLPRDE